MIEIYKIINLHLSHMGLGLWKNTEDAEDNILTLERGSTKSLKKITR